MKVKYLSKRVAAAMCEKYQFLIGAPFSRFDNEGNIIHVLVVPYGPILQWGFMRALKRGSEYNELLDSYNGEKFEVIVVSNVISPMTNHHQFREVRGYLEELSFNGYLFQ